MEISHKSLQTTSFIRNVHGSKKKQHRAREKHKIKSSHTHWGYRKSQEIGKCLINTLKMALNLSNKKYYMASLDELTFLSIASLHCFKRFSLAHTNSAGSISPIHPLYHPLGGSRWTVSGRYSDCVDGKFIFFKKKFVSKIIYLKSGAT